MALLDFLQMIGNPSRPLISPYEIDDERFAPIGPSSQGLLGNMPQQPQTMPGATPPMPAEFSAQGRMPQQQQPQSGGGLLGMLGLGGGGGLLGGLDRASKSPDWARTQQLLLGLGGSEQAMAEYLNPGAKNFDRWYKMQQLDLQRRQFEEKPTVQKRTTISGDEEFVRIMPDGSARVIKPEGGGGDKPVNPYSTGAKTTETQAKDATYATRAFGAERVLRDTEQSGTNILEKGLSKLPFGAGNFFVSPGFQKYEQAQRDFINAILRRESGAVISEPEFANAHKQYFPQPGDSQDVIAQKRANRRAAIEGIAGGAGPNYQPPATFGQGGELMPRQQAAPQPQSADKLPRGVTREQAMTQAAQALNRPGVTPEQRRAIYKRLQDWGVMQ